MRLEQFEYLIAVKNYNSMHAAAKKLFVSQQSISKAMKDLENELHVKIFERSSTGTQLTEAGQDIYLHVINIMNEMEYLKEKYVCAQNKSYTLSNMLKIYVSNIVFNLASDQIYRFSKAYDSKINIIEFDTSEIIKLFSESADEEIALIQIPLQDLKKQENIIKSYSCYILANERLKIVTNKHSKYAQYASISLKTLSEIPLVINTNSMDILPIHAKILNDMGIKLNIQFITNAMTTGKYLQDNIACALCTDSNFESIGDKTFLCLVPIKKKIFVATCLLVNKKHLSDVSKAFVETMLHNTDAEILF